MPSALDEMIRAWIRKAVSGTVRQVLPQICTERHYSRRSQATTADRCPGGHSYGDVAAPEFVT